MAESLTHGNLGDFICIDPEFPVQPRFRGGVVGLITFYRCRPKSIKTQRGILEMHGTERQTIPTITESWIDIAQQEFPFNPL